MVCFNLKQSIGAIFLSIFLVGNVICDNISTNSLAIGEVLSNSDYLFSNEFKNVFSAISSLNSSKCTEDALVVLKGVEKGAKWALKMFDSSSKFPVGLIYGNRYQLGNFDECVSIGKEVAAGRKIIGKYCLADIDLAGNGQGRASRAADTLPPKNVSLRSSYNHTFFWSVCVPSSCTTKEVEFLIHEIFANEIGEKFKHFKVQLAENKCHTDQGAQAWTNSELIYLCIITAVCCFTFFASLFHYYCLIRKKENRQYNVETLETSAIGGMLREILECFSIITTVGKLLQVKKNTTNAHLDCICGIRFLSMCFIIAGHSLLFMIGGPVLNSDFSEKETAKLENAIFTNSPLLVDTFLLLSGFLMCYLLLEEFTKRKRAVNFLILYVGRYIRLTPSYAVVIGFYALLLRRMGSGPLWDSRIGDEQSRCVDSWWTNLLYVNNYVNTQQMCMFQSWYLAVDYHLFIVAPFIIYPLWRWVPVGKAILGVTTVVSILVPFWITFSNELDPTFMAFAPEVYDLNSNYYFKNAYTKTHMRASSYFIGLIIGYIGYKLQVKGTKLGKFTVIIGWVLSALCGLVSMFSIVVFFDSEHEYSALEAASYACLHRVAWCVSIGWILLVCITDNASIVNRFLSWKAFMPLSRLTYCAYLVNGFIEIYSFGMIRTGLAMNKTELTSKAISHIVLTFALAFVVCILFESPIHGLEKILMRKDKAKQQKNQTTGQVTNIPNSS